MRTRDTQSILIGLVLLLLFTFVSGASAETMKIAVPSTGQAKDSLISQETGRAPFFLIFDEKGNFLEAVKNPAKDQYGGISRTVIKLLAVKGITLVIAKDIGDKMKQALDSHHIKFVKNTGAADNAVKTITQNP